LVARFPSLSSAEFAAACRELVSRFAARGELQCRWIYAAFDHDCLRIAKVAACSPGGGARGGLDAPDGSYGWPEPELERQNDPEELLRPAPRDVELLVEYSVILSPVYCVPVLHFSLRGASAASRADLDFAYRHVVTRGHTEQLRNPGIIGGLSMTNHPHSGEPVFFVHPCNTTAALEACAPDGGIDCFGYLCLWLGIIGGPVGLCVPPTLVVGEVSGSGV
ncbi:hypothetical protein BDY21DRAFT_271634, partial [Lineolata rhizophorae]